MSLTVSPRRGSDTPLPGAEGGGSGASPHYLMEASLGGSRSDSSLSSLGADSLVEAGVKAGDFLQRIKGTAMSGGALADAAPCMEAAHWESNSASPGTCPLLTPHRTGATGCYHGYLGPPAHLSPDWVMSRRQVSICTSRPLFMLHISMYSCRCRFMSFLAVASSSCQREMVQR